MNNKPLHRLTSHTQQLPRHMDTIDSLTPAVTCLTLARDERTVRLSSPFSGTQSPVLPHDTRWSVSAHVIDVHGTQSAALIFAVGKVFDQKIAAKSLTSRCNSDASTMELIDV